MSKNLLNEATARMGWLIDGNSDTPDIAVMLQDTGKQIVLTVPTKGMFNKDDPYSQWFSSGIQFTSEPDKNRYKYAPPRVLMFHDNDGTVILVGCRDTGFRSSMRAGNGKIVANFAVLGGKNLRYDRINGVRSELPALTEWTGQRSVQTTTEKDSQGRMKKVNVTLSSPPEIPLNHRMNLTLRPAWRTSFPDKVGTFSAHDVVQLQTTSQRPTDWKDHLDQHVAIRELLVLASWHSFGFSRLDVNRTDDPETLLNGKPVQPRWASVATHRLRKHEEWTRKPRFLFTLEDIGPKGVRRWLKLRSSFARAIGPLVALADQTGGFWESQMVQSGIALEALGYQLATDNGGAAFNSRGQIKYTEALETILADMPYVPLDDPDDWKRRSRVCYMGVKHADNSVPDSLILANTLRENLLVMRFWIAARLGCGRIALERRHGGDPLANEYVALE
jgi:hypothetical protein